MKLLIFIAIVVPAFVAVRAGGQMEDAINFFARAFNISSADVEKCVREKAATLEDLQSLSTAIEQASGVTDENTFNVTVDENGMRRAMCAVSCCAQTQGSLIGSQIQVAVIDDMIKRMPEAETAYPSSSVAVRECNEEVKEITDECDVAFRFIVCLAKKFQVFTDQ